MQSSASYTYGDSARYDLPTAYEGKTSTSDTIGNMLSDGTYLDVWKLIRELKVNVPPQNTHTKSMRFRVGIKCIIGHCS